MSQHESHQRYLRDIVPALARCPHCGGVAGRPGEATATHELCRLRAAKGSPTPRIDWTAKCKCRDCETQEQAQDRREASEDGYRAAHR